MGQFMYNLHVNIDYALSVSFRRPQSENNRYVARVTLVKGIPFYGFHVGYRFYLKIYMLNPNVMTRLADLLHQGVIMGRVFQPYEAHLQYLLQFMVDYNLYGCAYIDVDKDKVRFRSPVPMHDELSNSQHKWHSQSVPREHVTDDSSLPRVSHCSIEVDIMVRDILNRHEVKERRLHHDFIERLNPIPPDLKLVRSMAGLWEDERKRRQRRQGITDPRSSPFKPEELVSMSADPRNSQPPGWIHEDEYRDQIRRLIDEEEAASDGSKLTFESFVQHTPLEETVKTALEAVEDLYPENLLPALGLTADAATKSSAPTSEINVDEKGILALEGDEDDLFPGDSEEESPEARQDLEEDAKSTPSKSKAIKAEIDRLSQSTTVKEQALSYSSSKSSPKVLEDRNDDQPEGVIRSGIRDSRAPKVKFSDELIAIAEEEGLVSRVPRPERAQLLAGSHNVKRPLAELQRDLQSKRQRAESQLSKPGTGTQLSAKPPTSKSNTDIGMPVSSTQPKGRNEGSEPSRSQTDLKLNFSVVKDPNDPHTKMRLSQGTSSQKSIESPTVKKDASLDPTPAKPSSEASHEATTSPQPRRIPQQRSRRKTSKRSTRSSELTTWYYGPRPPAVAHVCTTFKSLGLPDVVYQDAYYSNEKDVPVRPREYAGREFRLESNTLPYLLDFDFGRQSNVSKDSVDSSQRVAEFERALHKQRKECTITSWEFARPPPSFNEVKEWWLKETKKDSHPRVGKPTRPVRLLSQIEGPTPKDRHGYKYSQKPKSTSVQHEAVYMSTMSLEIHVNTRGNLLPDPEEDEVQLLFWCLRSDEDFETSSGISSGSLSGIVVLTEDEALVKQMHVHTGVEVVAAPTELELMQRMVEIVRTLDPDILTGFEVHGSSWGYLIERARFKYDYGLCDEFSRMKTQSHGRFGKENDRWGFNTTSTIRVTGRHMINIWRAMRGELNLLQYTMENVAWHLLHRRIPHYSWRTLSDWYASGRPRDLARLLRYYLRRTQMDVEILEQNELIPRTSEQARLLGVDFFSVFSRGSQFKVESVMFRIAKPENFILASPSKKQVGGQNALECLPLVMEPQSDFYTSPLLVLDFQSLYPSVMIAYNYCYSTFLGRIVSWRGSNKMGFLQYKRQQRLLSLLKDYINIAPNGMMYTKPEIRKSLLAKMLTEILETRVMVKGGMKQDKDDRTLQQLLNNRQLALKLLANVTYGYTSASFSGRMPCSEIADSIVQTARETLEKAIALIHSVERWGAEVVYGDTDSLFVYLKGRTRDQAFDLGKEIADAVTKMNPRPVKLKFEKVYHPCILQTKKRYVGYKYESRDQTVPEFDAKGIETVRRDGTPAEQKIEEKVLRILFETADLSQVKAYFQRQCTKIMRGNVSIQDFCFAREVKLGTYSERGPPPPGALISTRRMLADARAEPQYGERVPYVVVTGAPGARLIDRCVAPEDLLRAENSHVLQLDADYYIGKNIIPPLERILNLVGANVRAWYDEIPRVQRVRRIDPGETAAAATSSGDNGGGPSKPLNLVGGGTAIAARRTLESYLRSASCVVCGDKIKHDSSGSSNSPIIDPTTAATLCASCSSPSQIPSSLLRLHTRLSKAERRHADLLAVCRTCTGASPLDDADPNAAAHACDSRDCPVFYSRVRAGAALRVERAAVEPAVRVLQEKGLLDW